MRNDGVWDHADSNGCGGQWPDSTHILKVKHRIFWKLGCREKSQWCPLNAFGLRNWEDGIDMGEGLRVKEVWAGRSGIQFGTEWMEMSTRRPSGDIEWVVGNVNLSFDIKVWGGGINRFIIGIEMIFKTMNRLLEFMANIILINENIYKNDCLTR